MKIDFLMERVENFLRDINFVISEKRWNLDEIARDIDVLLVSQKFENSMV